MECLRLGRKERRVRPAGRLAVAAVPRPPWSAGARAREAVLPGGQPPGPTSLCSPALGGQARRSGSRGVTELAIARAAEECVPFGAGENQRRAVRMPGVAEGHIALREECHLDAVPAGRAAVTALDPADVGQRARGHAIADAAHRDPSKSSSKARMMSLDSFGVALIALSLSMAAA